MSDHSWKDASFLFVGVIWPDACVSFAGGCLSVCEDCAIKPFKGTLHNLMPNPLINFLLRRLPLKYMIKRKSMIRLPIPHFNRFSIDQNTWLRCLLFLIKRSHTYEYFYCITCRCCACWCLLHWLDGWLIEIVFDICYLYNVLKLSNYVLIIFWDLGLNMKHTFLLVILLFFIKILIITVILHIINKIKVWTIINYKNCHFDICHNNLSFLSKFQ